MIELTEEQILGLIATLKNPQEMSLAIAAMFLESLLEEE